VLTIIENESNTWMIITVDDGLRVYSRAAEGDWSELPLGEDQEQVDPEKGYMLEELYGRESEGDEEEPDDEEESDEGEMELAEDEQPDDDEDEEPEEEPKPRRRRAAAPKG
jgi:nucleosome binding factor SPN SPT16 subunit